MSHRLSPYVHLDNRAKEALAFYQSVFGGEVAITTFGQFGTEGPDADLVMHGQLDTADGNTLMVADIPSFMTPGPKGQTITLTVFGDDAETLHRQFDALAADGGTVGTALAKQMWGDEYGDLTDKFGIEWAINISAPTTEGTGTD